MSDHPNVEPVVRALKAFNASDDGTLIPLLAPDIVWHVGGRNPMSGVHRGPEAVIKTHDKIRALFDPVVVTPHDILASDDHVVVLASVRLSRNGRPYEGNLGYVFHLTDGIITEGWVIQEDQVRWDEMCGWERQEDR